MNRGEELLAGIELGGTKCIAVLARGETILAKQAWPTGAPAETLAAVLGTLEGWRAQQGFVAIGIAAFGPLGLAPAASRYGHVLETTKPGWSGFDLLGSVQARFDLPIALDTDVAGAALAEQLWGGSVGCRVHAYVTIGTGVGGGIIVDGRPVHGFLHPEIGHMRVPRRADDAFAGICCFHGDCVEGLVSGPALEARTGLAGADIPADHPVWADVTKELGDFFANMLMSFAPERIALGGGVLQQRPYLLPQIRTVVTERLAGYLPDTAIAPAARIAMATLGANAGPLGAIALAALARG